MNGEPLVSKCKSLTTKLRALEKELAQEFKKQCTCLGENTKKYITFTVPTEKEITRNDQNEEEIAKDISYILQVIDRVRFIANSSDLANNFSLGIQIIKCKYGHDGKKCQTCRIKYKYCNCFLEYTNFKDDLIEYKCLCCNKDQHGEKLKERFFNT